MNFSTNLRNLRIEHHLTQQKLASDLGISQASITAYECGTREPTFEMIQRFADYFHVPAIELTPFYNAANDEHVRRVAEMMEVNPKLKDLFNVARFLPEAKLDVLIGVANTFRNND